MTLAPASRKQEMFLNSNTTVTLFGGAAGSGKTYTALLTILKYCLSDPHTTAIVFRRNTKMINTPGGIFSEAVDMYSTVDPKIRVRHRDNEIIFSNGAVVKFSHLEYEQNKYDHKGGQYSVVYFDEATDFTETMVTYLMTRMRNAKVKYAPVMMMATNPDYDSFLREWLEGYYLDEEGIPIEERAGHVRYFVTIDNKVLWYNSKEEAEAIYGSGQGNGITSFSFIPATCMDNPPLLKADPGYPTRLRNQPKVEMQRLLLGSWYARPIASGYWKRDWCEVLDYPDGRSIQRVRAWDLAATLPSDVNPNPDWTAGVLMSKNKEKYYTVEHVVRFRDRFAGVEQKIIEQAILDGPSVTILIPLDPGASANSYARSFQAKLAELGFTVKLVKPKSDKVTRFGPFAAMSEAGFIRVVKGDWYDVYCNELEAFTGERKNKDDLVDATSDSFNHLRIQQVIPVFSMPEFNSSNPFEIKY